MLDNGSGTRGWMVAVLTHSLRVRRKMKIHGNASLTIAQSELIQKLYGESKTRKRELARRF